MELIKEEENSCIDSSLYSPNTNEKHEDRELNKEVQNDAVSTNKNDKIDKTINKDAKQLERNLEPNYLHHYLKRRTITLQIMKNKNNDKIQNSNFKQENKDYNKINNNDRYHEEENEGSQDGYDLLHENENDEGEHSLKKSINSSINFKQRKAISNNNRKLSRIVTVVEHDSGFKSTGLSKNPHLQSSVSSQNNSAPIKINSDKISFKESSENSKPLSPATSPRFSPNEQAVDDIPDYEKLIKKPNSRNKRNTVTFKEEKEKQTLNASPNIKDKKKAENNSLTSSINKSSSSKIISILKN